MTTTLRLPTTFQRFRRLRRSEALRGLVAETRLDARDFVYPLFVTHGRGVRQEIESMPGQYQLSLDMLAGEAREQTNDLLVERWALLTSMQAHIHGGVLPASTRRAVRGRHATEGRPGRAIAQIDHAARGDGESLLCGSPSHC